MLRLPKYAADWPRSRAENMLMVMALYECELREANRQLALCGGKIIDFKDACSSLEEQRYSIIREEWEHTNRQLSELAELVAQTEDAETLTRRLKQMQALLQAESARQRVEIAAQSRQIHVQTRSVEQNARQHHMVEHGWMPVKATQWKGRLAHMYVFSFGVFCALLLPRVLDVASTVMPFL